MQSALLVCVDSGPLWVQCSPACMHSSHWSHQHPMTATRRAATRLRLDWTEVGPTLPHFTLVHVQVTECSTATDTHAAGAQDGSQSALTAGPNPTQNTSSGLRLQCALTRGARVQDSTTAAMSCWQRGQREQLQTQFAPRLSLLQSTHSLDPTRVPHVPHHPAPRGPHSPGGRG